MIESIFSPSIFVHSNDSFGGGHFIESIYALLETLVSSGFAAFLMQAFPGIHALPNIHPLVVHFPIALFTTFFLLEVLAIISRSERIYYAASWTLFAGIIFAVTAILLGMQAARSVPHGGVIHSIIDQHQSYATAATGVAFVLALWRKVAGEQLMVLKPQRFLHLIIAMVMVLLIFLTADLGGLMVFKFGVGVQR